MTDIIITVLMIIGIFIGIPVAFLFVRDWANRPLQKKLDVQAKRFTERLLNPDVEAVAQYFNHPLPAVLQELYQDKQELLREDFEVAESADAPEGARWYIAYYQPADDEAIQNTWPGLEEYFAFANDGAGNDYVIDPREADPPVLFHDHETGEFSYVCDALSEFMQWPRLDVID